MARTVAIIVGSIRKESINLKLAKALVKLAPNDFDCDFIRIDDLPVYNQDLDQSPPEAVSRTKSQIAAAKALLFVTPEHKRLRMFWIGYRGHTERICGLASLPALRVHRSERSAPQSLKPIYAVCLVILTSRRSDSRKCIFISPRAWSMRTATSPTNQRKASFRTS